MNNPHDPERYEDPRPKAVGKVGGIGVAMLAISIPLTGILGAFAHEMAIFLPVAVIGGTALSMIVIWLTPPRRIQPSQTAAITELRQQLTQMNERLTNLEIIDSFERRMAHREAAQLLPQDTPPHSATTGHHPHPNANRQLEQ